MSDLQPIRAAAYENFNNTNDLVKAFNKQSEDRRGSVFNFG